MHNVYPIVNILDRIWKQQRRVSSGSKFQVIFYSLHVEYLLLSGLLNKSLSNYSSIQASLYKSIVVRVWADVVGELKTLHVLK